MKTKCRPDMVGLRYGRASYPDGSSRAPRRRGVQRRHPGHLLGPRHPDVVVTCTNGEYGDAPGGIKPGQDGHDERRWPGCAWPSSAVLSILRVTDLETLGYRDSGMAEWDYKHRPDAFCNVPLRRWPARIAGLIDQYRPQVLITYDDKGAYQHPDHVHASRAAQAAVAVPASRPSCTCPR